MSSERKPSEVLCVGLTVEADWSEGFSTTRAAVGSSGVKKTELDTKTQMDESK